MKHALIVLILLLASPVWADSADEQFKRGWDALNEGDYATALQLWRPLAEQGDVHAQYGLGALYDNGRGVIQDYSLAAKWYRKAAEQGYAAAQYNVGRMYRRGEGVTQDDAEAVRWYRKAAEQGYATAQANLGVMYHGGQGVTQSYETAIFWFCTAIKEKGNGIAQAASMNVLGAMYGQGQGVTQDYVQAHKWINLATARQKGKLREAGVKTRDALASKMTPAAINQAQRLAREWTSDKPCP